MGLDMYLSKIHIDALPYMEHDPEDTAKDNPDLYAEMKPHLHMQGTPDLYEWESLFQKVGYWRKANQIHNWFVNNVQEGEDDCEDHEVTEEQLRELRDICIAVATQCVMVPGRISNGYTYENNVMKPIMVKGKIILNPEVAQEMLPTQSGFFFGSTDYDEYYLKDVTNTIKIINDVLEQTDFSQYTIYYRASW